MPVTDSISFLFDATKTLTDTVTNTDAKTFVDKKPLNDFSFALDVFKGRPIILLLNDIVRLHNWTSVNRNPAQNPWD